MGLRLADRWVWDFWTAHDGRLHHLFFLAAPRSLGDPDLRHWNVRVGHAVSTDLRDWTVLPDVLAPADRPAWDDMTTWTGSVLRHEGQWWMFYTGTSRREQGKVQRIGAATSTDLSTWHRVGTAPLVEADPRWYELYDPALWYEQAWRDPWVVADGEGTFHMFVTARAGSGPGATRGVIGHATSPDLRTWSVGPPVTTPGVLGHLEVPQVVPAGGRHHLLFTTPPGTAEGVARVPGVATGGTHALSAEALTGPYDWSSHQLVDGDARVSRYAGRLVRDEDGWQLLSWVQHDDEGRFVGEIADPVPVTVTADGVRRVHDRTGPEA